jgi:uncharacterized protein
MKDSSRRNFLAAGLALPVAGLASTTANSGAPAPGPTPADAPGKIAYRTLGKTGLKVSTVGYGCMITSDATVITRAVDMGITYFDSSRNYQGGNNERMVGAALGAKRKNIVLSTKQDTRDKAGAEKELETSLKELNTDYLDIWHLHAKDTPEAISDELLEVQRAAKKAGKIRFMAVSTHALPRVVDRILEAKVDVVTAQYNFTSDPAFTAAAKRLADAGVGLVAMKVMAGGMRGRTPKPQMQRPNAAAAALKWVIKNPSFATTIPSMTDNEQLDQNFAVMAGKFDDNDAKILSARLEEIKPYYCRACGQCDGKCPKGLPVRDMVRFVTYADGYGQFGVGREYFQKLSEEHQAVRCSDCGSCAIKCPNGVQVAKQMIRCQELYA